MRKLCSHHGCKVIVDVDPSSNSASLCSIHQRTPAHTPKKRYEHAVIDGKRIYGTYRWRKTSLRYRASRPLCERCLRFGLITDSKLVDHKVELSDGGDPWDEDNFEALCSACHNRKTANEARKRSKKGNSLSDF